MECVDKDIVVIGGGPGGYAAAFSVADQGRQAVIVERDPRLGGVCMNRGCIPSKALLNAVHAIRAAKESALRGIAFGEPTLDLDRLRQWKNGILERLGGGIAGLAKMRGVEVVQGTATFVDSKTLQVSSADGLVRHLRFQKAILATGSRPLLPKAFDLGSPRIMTSTEALELPDIPASLLVVGGGYIGMELGTVYATLGSKVTVIEAQEALLAGADPDLVRPVGLFARKAFQSVRLKSKVLGMEPLADRVRVTSETEGKTVEEEYDRVLVSVGRVPNSEGLGLENTRVERDDRGFVRVDASLRTSDPDILAIGDVAGGLMLAHKATWEAKVAADQICGRPHAGPGAPVIPAVVFTDPEVAWVGLTEQEASRAGTPVEIAKFPWGASGRAITLDRIDGLTKLVLEPGSRRILGVGIVGVGAGELIGEGALAVQTGATAEQLSQVIHPHPTLSETLLESAEAALGRATHIFQRRR
ncbi:MAG: Dihydrolipoyl dehydrogenase [Verrucomicrobiota bacterium]|jgi:dihydrolipoamide dehydrogenase